MTLFVARIGMTKQNKSMSTKIEHQYLVESTYLEVYEQAQEIMRCREQVVPSRLRQAIASSRLKIKHLEDRYLFIVEGSFSKHDIYDLESEEPT